MLRIKEKSIPGYSAEPEFHRSQQDRKKMVFLVPLPFFLGTAEHPIGGEENLISSAVLDGDVAVKSSKESNCQRRAEPESAEGWSPASWRDETPERPTGSLSAPLAASEDLPRARQEPLRRRPARERERAGSQSAPFFPDPLLRESEESHTRMSFRMCVPRGKLNPLFANDLETFKNLRHRLMIL
ncbi:Hypothetical predicted protein [Podarcis lilfordi]|uniref:Uncharacterized protein n=1 Tax=Podarcis lilfordi TaxID=74358 RepID=A0AA35L1T5_9SAUR|nr:Hypothetical predicted protein [Podarcis lilfordi]